MILYFLCAEYITHCGPVNPYYDIDSGQHWLMIRLWLVAWRAHAISWTYFGSSLKVFCGIYMGAISHGVLMNLICSMCWESAFKNYCYISQEPMVLVKISARLYSWTNKCRKNIDWHAAHTIVSWPNPKQWVIVHTSDLMMIISVIRQCAMM